jgi:16S rRNA pseudouridine516 synthase
MPRLVELLARNLGVSKTAAARLIEAGRVHDASGSVYTDRRTLLAEGDGDDRNAASEDVPLAVTVDGERIILWSQALILLHKPVGVVTALRDPVHRTAYDLLSEAPLFHELRAVGRLDLETSGLLLWTTEGALVQRLTHPKRRVPRTYQAALARPFQSWSGDLVLDDGHRPEVIDLRPISRDEVHPGLFVPSEAAALATVTIVGGAYHEVRRLFAALGSHVLGLCRTSFGKFTLPPNLPAGDWRRLPSAMTTTTTPMAARADR